MDNTLAATKTSIFDTDPPASGPGDNVTIEASVKAPGSSGPAPTGTVTFTYYTVGVANSGPITGPIGTASLVDGVATITTKALPAGGPQNGSITLNATYNGDHSNAASNGLAPYYVLTGCSLGSWGSASQGYYPVKAGGPEGYYIGQSNGIWEVYVTHPTVGKVTFSGTITTGPSGDDYTDGVLINLSSLKNEGPKDKVTLVGANEIKFTLVNGGDLDGFSFFAGCGSELDFTLNIGTPPVKAKKSQIFIGVNGTKGPNNGKYDVTRN